MATTFQPNPELKRELGRDPRVRQILNGHAEEALTAAQAIAAGFRNTGAYEQSLAVRGATLLTTDFAGHMVEFGSVNNPPYAPLRRAAEQVGAKVVDTGA